MRTKALTSQTKLSSASTIRINNAVASEISLPLYIGDIERILPHRYPFLLVDRVIGYTPGESITGLKNISATEPCFTGHFPGRPVFPGVLQLEALAQLGAIFARLETTKPGESISDGLIVFAGADEVRFRRLVVPGDTLEISMTIVKRKLRHWTMRGVAKVGADIAAEGLLRAAEMRNRAV
jgi:3-hydroxyacyl-[acyl-carrier-protein] dehydratase